MNPGFSASLPTTLRPSVGERLDQARNTDSDSSPEILLDGGRQTPQNKGKSAVRHPAGVGAPCLPRIESKEYNKGNYGVFYQVQVHTEGVAGEAAQVLLDPRGIGISHRREGRKRRDIPEGFHLHEYTATELARPFRMAGFSRVRFMLSVSGRRLTPLLPVGLLRPAEALLDALPRAVRRPLARGLAAVKVVAIK
jgi:hypothetical protein